MADAISQKESQDGLSKTTATNTGGNPEPSLSKQNLPQRVWSKAGLNPGLLIMMFKSALAPTIALAIYQDSGVASVY